MGDRRSVFPGFDRLGAARREVVGELVQVRQDLGLSQTEVAARMQTSQSAVARLESGEGDLRVSTLERYAAALGHELRFELRAKEEA